jgi:hypothetical protein
MYKDDEDEAIIDQLNDMQRQMILGDRFEKAQAAEYKFKAQREIYLNQQKISKEKEALKTLGKRKRPDSSDEDESDDRSYSSRSNQSSQRSDSYDHSYDDRGLKGRRQKKMDQKRGKKQHEY